MTTDRDLLLSSMPRITAALQGLVRDLEVTNDQWLVVLGFLTEVGREDEFVLLSDVLGVSRIVDDQTHAAWDGTSSNVLGPFYRPGAPLIDNPGSIVREAGSGAPIWLSGSITDAASGDALPGAVVDVWQADTTGVYSNEDARLDPWNLRGRQLADADGRFAIETVRPRHYTVKHDGPVGRLLATLGRHPFRPAHIHLMVEMAGYRTLVTQAYIAGGPYLDDDAITGVKSDLVVGVVDGAIRFDVALVRDPGKAKA